MTTSNQERNNARQPLNYSDQSHLLPALQGDRSHSPGHGLDADTPVPTQHGWTRIADLAAGQQVFDEMGRLCQVTGVSREEPQPVCLLTMDDGSTLTAAPDCNWVTLSHRARALIHEKSRTLAAWSAVLLPITTAEIGAQPLHSSGNCIESMHSIPLPLPLLLPHRDLLIDPYLLGLWLGDGSSGVAQITCHRDDEPCYRAAAMEAGENWRILSEKGDVLLCSLAGPPEPRFTTRLKSLGVRGNKHVPAIYLRSSPEQRLELLMGLMDTDGTTTVNGHAEYTSISEALARGVLELALSLGQKATLRKGLAKLYGRVVSDKWRVHFNPTCQVARLPRKADRLTGYLEWRKHIPLTRLQQRYIRSVAPAGNRETTAISVNSPSGLFLAGDHLIPVRGVGLAWRAQEGRLISRAG